MRIDDATEQRIKDAADIVDVISDFVDLKKKGARYMGLCPFHDDHTPDNFSVYPRDNVFRCFACDAKGGPVDFIMMHEGLDYPDALRWLAKKYGIFIEGADKFNAKPSKPRPPRPPEPPKRLRLWPLEWVRKHRATPDNDNFVRWLYSLPWDETQRERLPKVLMNYGIGHSHFTERDKFGNVSTHDFTIFWQCDELAQLHNGHLIKYKDDGHRVKDKNLYPTSWIHARMTRAKSDPFDPDNDQASYCLFGQHLMAACPDATINIVESEKTAVVMATAYGNASQNLWMACYGKSNLINANRLLRPLIRQGRRIVLYPDHDGIADWQKVADEINYEHLTINTDPVVKWWKPEDGDKADVADIILRLLSQGIRDEVKERDPRRQQIAELREQYPTFNELADRFDLQPKD